MSSGQKQMETMEYLVTITHFVSVQANSEEEALQMVPTPKFPKEFKKTMDGISVRKAHLVGPSAPD